MEIKPGDIVKIQGSKGPHKVIAPDGNGHRVEDPHGNEVWVPNSKITIPTVRKKATTGGDRSIRYIRHGSHFTATDQIPVVGDAFLGHVRRSCWIGGSGPTKHRARFEMLYQDATGHVINGQGAHVAWHEHETTFSYGLRITFPTPVDCSILPPTAHPLRQRPGFHEICSNSFIFELFRLGLDLGFNGTLSDAA